MKRVVTTILAAGWLFGCGPSKAPEAAVEPTLEGSNEDQFPIWAMTILELGNLLEGAAWQPKVISFYDTDCERCRVEHTLLANYQREHPKVKVVLVSLDEPETFKARTVPYLQDAPLDHLTHVRLEEVDPRAALRESRPDLGRVPSTLFVQPDGSVLHRVDGNLDIATLERWGAQLTPPAPLR